MSSKMPLRFITYSTESQNHITDKVPTTKTKLQTVNLFYGWEGGNALTSLNLSWKNNLGSERRRTPR
ncbi:hypothetical protein C2G38_2256891 [Gigaspora rosea]|uniref:Uncharacterized protein n=1 Tax=Gigaspora rosea TaxID=44941 RepID=A0A397TPE9_9GLOM|nr:hypothetical protein C2G38_2256891 [Gigaspora rosea]